jgi:AcrR family transcriptional regulator
VARALAKRLPPAQRREQLVVAAAEVAAEQGYAHLSLDDVAERAGVTRNLLYHYFPAGRRDLYVAALERAGDELTGGWVTDQELPLDQRLAMNFGRMVEHSSGPSTAWRLFRQSRALADPEIDALNARYVDMVVESVSLNHFGTADPPPLARMALESFFAYGEVALDAARTEGLAHEDVMGILAETLVATVASVKTRL